MKNFLQTTQIVNYSEVDVAYRLRYDSILSIFQKITLMHSTELKVDAPSLLKNSNAFWVLCKSKFKINRLPIMNDQLTLKTWPTVVTPLRFYREYVISCNENEDIVGTSEWCTFDYTTRTVRRSNTIAYPYDMEHITKSSGAGDYSKKREAVGDCDFSHSHVSKFVDVDPNNHTNNVAYVRMALDTFSPDEFINIDFTEFEIYFNNQSYYGDKINIYRKKTDYGYYVEGKILDKTIFTAIFKTK